MSEDRNRRLQIVTTLWNEGQTSGYIADVLGVSRSSVMGMVHRLGLSGRRLNATPRAARKPKPPTKFNFATNASKATPRPLEPEPYVSRETVVTPEHLRIPFEDLDDKRCKYAHGDNPPYAFCGAKVVPTTIWCPTHFAKVFGTPAPEGTGGFTQQTSENIGELEGAA